MVRSVGLDLSETANVASEENKKEQGDKKGFAGLASMVSDVDATLANIPKQTGAPGPSTRQSAPAPRPEQLKATPRTHPPPVQPSGDSSTGKWLFGIAAVIGVIWLVSQADTNGASGPAPSAGASTLVGPPPQRQAPSRPAEAMPSVGQNNVLTTAQIRYCLAEDIRLEAARTAINSYVDSDVDRFNGYVADYNSRCGEYRYQQGALERAQRDIEPYRGQLQTEGISRFVSSAAPARTPTQVGSRRASDPTVQAIQRRLNELGYDAGAADGILGNKTRAAIQAFQRDNGIASDGNASQSLLQTVLASKRASNALRN